MHEEMHTIIVVDDHPMFLDAISQAISRKFPQANLKLFTNIADTLNELSNGILPSLAVVDLGLPDGDGVDLIDAIHTQYRIPVIAFSGLYDRFTIKACIDKGVSAFVKKTANTNVLYSAVDAVMSGGCYFPPGMLTAHSRETVFEMRLTARQQDVLDLILMAYSNKAIADKLELAEGTVKNHITDLLAIFGVKSRSELSLKVRQQRYSPQKMAAI